MSKDQGYKLCPAGISCLMEIKDDKKPNSLKIDLGVETLPGPSILMLKSSDKYRFSNAFERLMSPDQFLQTCHPPSDFSIEHMHF